MASAAVAVGCQTRRSTSAQVPEAAWETAAPPNPAAARAVEALLSNLDTTSVGQSMADASSIAVATNALSGGTCLVKSSGPPSLSTFP